MEDSLVVEVLPAIPAPADLAGKELHRILNNDFLIHNLKKRVRDLQKNIRGCANELGSLTRMTDVINSRQVEDVVKGVEKNTKSLVDACAAKERASAALEIMQVVFAASMAFDLIDKFTAIDLNMDFADWQVWIEENLCRPPGAWFAFNMSICFFMCWCLNKLMAYLADKSLNFLTFEVTLNRKIDAKVLKDFLDEKPLEVSDAGISTENNRKSAIWEEEDEELWEGAPPRIEIQYDAKNGYLLVAQFTIDRKESDKSELELQAIFIEMLIEAGVVDVEDR
jgi:hypothetical protein